MVVLRINNADLPNGWTHNFTDWQVSTSQDFSSILLESLNDAINLTTMVFDQNLELGVNYYGRARMLLNNGFTEWCNICVFTPKDLNEVSITMDMPSVITTPTLKSSFDLNSHPRRFFTVFIDNGFSTQGNAGHESTTWIVEDDTGKPIWSSLDDRENLLSLDVDFNLKINKVYRVHASLKGTNGDISQFGTLTFYTSDVSAFNISRVINRYELDGDLEVIHPFINGLDKMTWELYSDSVLVDNGVSVDPFFTLNKEDLTYNKYDIVRVKTEINSVISDWSYVYIITSKDYVEPNDGGDIPFNNGVDAGFISFPLSLPYRF